MGGDKIICLPPKAAFNSILYCMHGQRDEKGIMSTPKRKKHHIDYTHIKKKMNKKSWEIEESPRGGLRLRLGGDKMVLSTPKGGI